MSWFLVACVAGTSICNVFMEFQFDSRDLCEMNREALQAQNPQVTWSICVEMDRAHNILTAAAGHMEDRAQTYDSAQGERSMRKTVDMFNALTDSKMSEEEGWMFMALLKIVRSQQGSYRADNYEDLAAYAALAGETASDARSWEEGGLK